MAMLAYTATHGHIYTNVGSSLIIDGNIRIQNWQAGNLSLNMTGPAAMPANPVTTRDITGDLALIDYDPVTAGVQVHLDDIDNAISNSNIPDTNRVDLLLDSTGNDHLMGGGGDDIITAFRGGDDLIEGGAGNDVIFATARVKFNLKGGVGNDKAIKSHDKTSNKLACRPISMRLPEHLILFYLNTQATARNDNGWRVAA